MKLRLPSHHHNAAFTLIELVISAALMSVILVAAYLCLNAGLSSQKLVEPRAEIMQNARVAMALMAADLRGACPLSKETAFLGMQRMLDAVEADNLDFGTHHYTPRRAREGDFCQESFYLDKDSQTGQISLWRRRNPTIAFDPLAGGSREEIATGVLGLRFEYFDGLDWYNTWGELKAGKRETTQRDEPNLSGMPMAVRITLLLDSNPKSRKVSETGERVIEPPLAFQTVVQLELAANDLESGGKSVPNAGSGDSTGGQGTPN